MEPPAPPLGLGLPAARSLRLSFELRRREWSIPNCIADPATPASTSMAWTAAEKEPTD